MSIDSLRKNLVGVNVAMPVFFKPDLSLDLKQVRDHTRFVIENGIRTGDGVLICIGAGGENSHLTGNEQGEVARVMIESANKEVPVLVGVWHPSTLEAIRLAKQAEHIGADGLQVAPPNYWNHSEEEIFRYVKAISEEVSIGIMLYNTPWNCAYDMDIAFVSRCLELKNIIGIKWYSKDQKLYRRMYEVLGQRINIIDNWAALCGSWGFILGACGFASQTSNFAPQEDITILKLLRENKYDDVYKMMTNLFFPYYDLIDDFCREGISGEGNYVKAALDLIGRYGGPSRPPHIDLPSDYRERLRRVLDKSGILLQQKKNL